MRCPISSAGGGTSGMTIPMISTFFPTSNAICLVDLRWLAFGVRVLSCFARVASPFTCREGRERRDVI